LAILYKIRSNINSKYCNKYIVKNIFLQAQKKHKKRLKTVASSSLNFASVGTGGGAPPQNAKKKAKRQHRVLEGRHEFGLLMKLEQLCAVDFGRGQQLDCDQ
jgi:hypothetical protein